MPDDELDQRLRRLLSSRASAVTPQLDGPTIRAAADTRPSTARRVAAPLSLAAAIVLLAFTPSLLRHGSGDSHRQPPGVSISVSVPPVSTVTPTPTPTTNPSTAPPSPTQTTTPTTPTTPTVSLPTSRTSLPSAPTAAVPGTSTLPTIALTGTATSPAHATTTARGA